MNFTRDPLVQTIITPKEGFKLVIRNSKVGGQEEFFVDAIEVISFGNNCFFRSLEKPKCFLVPASDYEIFEARETRVALKTQGVERGIKIGGGREASITTKVVKETKEEEKVADSEVSGGLDSKGDKRRERRRSRKRRDKTEEEADKRESRFPDEQEPSKKPREERPTLIIPPPSMLISETIGRYKDIEVPKESISEKEIEEERNEEEFENHENDQEIPFNH